MTLIFCESRQLAASRFIPAGVTDLKSSHDAGPTFAGELSLRDSQTSPTIERQANESSPRVHCDGESLEGAALLKSAVLATAILLASPTAVVAEPPVVSTHATPPAPTASKSDPNQTGWQPSAYRGWKFRAAQERLRRCIGQREGRFQYWGTGGNGRYEGPYQMTDALVRGAAWMMRPELIATYGKQGAHVFRVLLRTPGHRWSRFYMDAAFYAVLNARGDLSGISKWSGGRWRCAS